MDEQAPPEERKASTVRFTTETLRRIHHYRRDHGMTFGAAVNALVIQALRQRDEDQEIRSALHAAAIKKNPSGGHS